MDFNNNISKQMEIIEYSLDGCTFYIYPLPAFTAANLSGEVISLLAPLLGGVASAFKGSGEDGSAKNIMDMDISEAAPGICAAFSSLSSDKMEKLLRKLLNSGNVGVRMDGSADAQPLTEELCNEVFCRNVQNMFLVAFQVLKVNYSDFFGSIGNLSGNVKEALKKAGFPSTEPLTQLNSAS